MNSRSFEILRRKSRGKFSMDKFVKLKSLAKNTIGVYDDCYRIELETLLDLYYHLDSKIDEVEAQISEIVEKLNPPTLSIKGVGSMSAAIILSKLGDISRFKSSDKMLAFAGLEPGHFQSGTAEYNGHMVKHGSAPLRCALMNCARAIPLHNETFAVYYQKKISEGKPYYVAISHVLQ